ncbi:DUF2335 domain-containing protein [Ignatzschineria cameli]|nr:DUF2335 domain-containing protein [Ignatzschineria cameli]
MKKEITKSDKPSKTNQTSSNETKDNIVTDEVERITQIATSDLPSDIKEEKIKETLQIESQIFSGPLPPPILLEEYEKIIPGSAKEIIEMSVAQRKHTMQIEKALTDSEISRVARSLKLAEKSNTRGTWLIWGLIIASLISIWSNAHPAVSIAFLSLPIIMGLKNLLFNHANHRDRDTDL